MAAADSNTENSVYALRRKYVDFDKLAEEVRHWNLDLVQLGRGPFQGEVFQYGTHVDNVHVSHARFRQTLLQQGVPPTGLRTIVVPAQEDLSFGWRGYKVTGKDLAIFPTGSELYATSDPDFQVYTCSFPEELLATICESMDIDQLDVLRADAAVVRCHTSAMKALRDCLSELSNTVSTDTSVPYGMSIIDTLTWDLPARLLSSIATADSVNAPDSKRKRLLAVIRAEAYIKENARSDIRMFDICKRADVSQRTLEYAFVERFGVTPKAFLKAYRLNMARRDLRSSKCETGTVSDVANRWGFWHMGQFARDYRAHFDELPSQTLRNSHGQRLVNVGRLR